MKGYVIDAGYMGYVDGQYMLFANEDDYRDYMNDQKKTSNSRILEITGFLMPAVGLEPTRGYPQQILSLHRLPFRHAGLLSAKNILP